MYYKGQGVSKKTVKKAVYWVLHNPHYKATKKALDKNQGGGYWHNNRPRCITQTQKAKKKQCFKKILL